jgi:hypothetical protein
VLEPQKDIHAISRPRDSIEDCTHATQGVGLIIAGYRAGIVQLASSCSVCLVDRYIPPSIVLQ